MLITPGGQWRDNLWLDDIVLAATEDDHTPETPRRELTAPLPINTCSVDSLTLLPGVGPVLAARIQEFRAQGLVFRDSLDLRQVKGIGPKLSARLTPLIDFSSSCVQDTASGNSP
jgi:DNA uptake protein ComE-like DNA-binding protein